MPKKKRKSKGGFRERWYPYLCRREGEHCQICNQKPPDVYLEIDHKDDNPANNHLSNFQLLCRSDNRKKTPRGKGKGKDLIQDSSVIDRAKVTSAEFEKNKRCEPAFKHWLYQKLRKEGKMLLHEIINGGAKAAGCSPITTKRYLAVECSIEGLYQIYIDTEADAKFVRFKSGETIGITADLLGDSATTIDERVGPS